MFTIKINHSNMKVDFNMIWNIMVILTIFFWCERLSIVRFPHPHIHPSLGKLQVHDLNLEMGPCTIGDCFNLDESEITLWWTWLHVSAWLHYVLHYSVEKITSPTALVWFLLVLNLDRLRRILVWNTRRAVGSTVDRLCVIKVVFHCISPLYHPSWRDEGEEDES